MKLEKFIELYIKTFHVHFLCSCKETSRKKVLTHIYFASGNGLQISEEGFIYDPLISQYRGPNRKIKSTKPFIPYGDWSPNTLARKIANNHTIVNEDWVKGAIEAAQNALEFYSDPSQCTQATKFPNTGNINQCVLDNRDTDGTPAIEFLVDRWRVEYGEAITTLSEILTKFGVEHVIPEEPKFEAWHEFSRSEFEEFWKNKTPKPGFMAKAIGKVD